MKIISNETGETIANILTNHSMTLDEALDLVGAEPLEAENSCDPDYILNGVELWYDDLDLVPDSWDITGQRHGSLTAIRPTDKRHLQSATCGTDARQSGYIRGSRRSL